MAQWGRNDQSVTANSSTTKETSNGAPMGTYALVKGSGNSNTNPVSMDSNAHFGNTSSGSRASVDVAMYGNTTFGAFIPGMAVGVFAVNASMMNTTGGGIILSNITNAGSGYAANAAVTLTAVNGGTGATANATVTLGHVTALNANQTGSGCITAPTTAIAAPAAITFNGNTAVSSSAETITIATANSIWQVNDHLTYTVAAGNTSIVDANTGPKSYSLYVAFANTTVITLTNSIGGANLNITGSPVSETGHSIQGDTATGYFDVSSAYPQVTHSGWVVRREGTGGRAGRVQYETLVAFGTLGAQTAPAPANPSSNSTVDAIV